MLVFGGVTLSCRKSNMPAAPFARRFGFHGPVWCIGYIGDYTTQLCGIIINHYTGPYQTTSIMESTSCFCFRGSTDASYFCIVSSLE